MRKQSLRSSSPSALIQYPIETKPSAEAAIERLEQTQTGSKTRANQLREVFYRSRHNYEFCTDLANADIIKKILLKPVNSNANENERHWAAAVLENVVEFSEEGKQKCYECGGLGIIMKRIYKEKYQTETKRSCIVALGALIRLNREVKDACVKFGVVKMLMELLEEYDGHSVGAEITFALGHLMHDQPDEVAVDVAERGGCAKLIKSIQNNLNRHDRRYGLWTLSNLLSRAEKSRDECVEKGFQSDLVEYIQNDFSDDDGVKLDAVHCMKLLAQHSEDVKNLCKDSFLLIFLQPLGEAPNYSEPDLEEKVGHVNELAVLLGGDAFTLQKPEEKEDSQKPPKTNTDRRVSFAESVESQNQPEEDKTEE